MGEAKRRGTYEARLAPALAAKAKAEAEAKAKEAEEIAAYYRAKRRKAAVLLAGTAALAITAAILLR